MIWLNLGRTVFAATTTATSAAASTQDTTMPTMRLALRLPFWAAAPCCVSFLLAAML